MLDPRSRILGLPFPPLGPPPHGLPAAPGLYSSLEKELQIQRAMDAERLMGLHRMPLMGGAPHSMPLELREELLMMRDPRMMDLDRIRTAGMSLRGAVDHMSSIYPHHPGFYSGVARSASPATLGAAPGLPPLPGHPGLKQREASPIINNHGGPPSVGATTPVLTPGMNDHPLSKDSLLSNSLKASIPSMGQMPVPRPAGPAVTNGHDSENHSR